MESSEQAKYESQLSQIGHVNQESQMIQAG